MASAVWKPEVRVMHTLWLCSYLFSTITIAQTSLYKVQPGSMHKSGKMSATILPDTKKFNVKLTYEIQAKNYVPIPEKFLKGEKVYEFPNDFRTEKGYKELQRLKTMSVPKAELRFVKRQDVGHLKDAYVFQVLPTNKKTKIDIVYHPSIPSLGWSKVRITFISNIPVLNGYEVKAELK